MINFRKTSLIKILKKEKKTDKELRKLVKSKKESFWISKTEIIFVVVSFLLFIFISHIQSLFLSQELIDFLNRFIAFKEDNHYQNLIAIHAGIGAVLIGLAFFVAQEITKEKENPYKGIILLRRSKFFPLLMAEILFFFQFFWGSVNTLSIIPIFIIGIVTIYSLYQTINLMADNFYLKKEESKLFFRVIRKSFLKVLDFEVTQTLGNNQISKNLKQKNKIIQFTPFPPFNKKEYMPIKTEKLGFFVDLNFGKLAKFLNELQKLLPEDKTLSENITDTKDTKEESVVIDPYCYLTPRFYSNLKESNNVLFWIKKDILEENSQNKLTELAQKVIKIDKSIQFDPEETRNQILKIKARCIKAINEQKIDELHNVINIYVDLISDFYKYLEPYGGGFSEKQAKDMRTEIFFGSFRFVDWLSKDIKEIFDKGIQSKNINIIKEVAYLPIVLVRYAIDHKDHLIFQEFSYYPYWLYRYALKDKQDGNEELADFMFDRTWRYLKELSDYHLVPKLKEDNYPEEEFKDFAVGILKIFQNLIKTSLSKRDIVNFGKFSSITTKLFKNLDIHHSRHNQDQSENIFDFLDNKRKQMFFGLASWTFFLFERNKQNKKLKEFFNEINNKLPSDIKKFTEIFVESHDFQAEDFWGWDNWELQEKEEGEVHSIQILEKLEKLYAVRSLIILSGKSEDEINKIQLPPSRDLAFLAEGTRDLIKILDDIKDNPKNWEFILSENATQKVDVFKNLLDKAKKEQEEVEIEIKKKNPVSIEKIKEFKNKVMESFHESATIRNIFVNYLEKYEDKIQEKWTGNKGRFGINIVDNKAAFFDKWHVHYSGWGDNYGQDMALGENSNLLNEISKNCTEITSEEFNDKIKEFDNLKNLFIFITDGLVLWDSNFQKLINFLPHYQSKNRLDVKGFVCWGQIDNIQIPVFETFYRGKERKKEMLILDKTKLGSLVQYSPLNEDEDNNLIRDVFYINVQSFSEDDNLLDNFVKQNPPQWLTDIGTEEEQKEHLKERVLIHVFERFGFVKQENFKGFRIKL